MDKPWLFTGKLVHTRFFPHHHSFSYPAFFLCFPLARKAELASRLFSLDRFNLFSFHESDHGDGRDGEAWARRLLHDHDINASGDIWLQTLPRVLGFVFNPVSFWFCHDGEARLRAVICEVNNTFGERHCYLLENGGEPITTDSPLSCRKVFHVSPFFDRSGEYRFRFLHQGERRVACIDYWSDDGRPQLKTAIGGDARALTDTALLRLFLSFGWSTLLVVLRIHWQALLLWMKGMPFHKKPLPPREEISR
ncbi:MAG: hypothetical protein K0R03_75 [Moraxellaceae bacterium]|jgi:DUF1365 family protein|nr:hypothetical protein [Moraxellaceae bacterium]